MPYTPPYASWKDLPDTTTPITAAALNTMDAGIADAIPKDLVTAAGDLIYATAAATLARLALGAAGNILKGGASAPSWGKLTNADVDAAAAIAYSKLNLAGAIVNADIATAAAIALSKLAQSSATLGQFMRWDGSSWSPASRELDYVQFTATVTISATTEATANTVVTATALTLDGSTPVVIEFFSPMVSNTTTGQVVDIWLYQDGSSIGRIGSLGIFNVAGNTRGPVKCEARITPSSGSHTYSVRASMSSGTGVVDAGAGGAAAMRPGFIRITRAT